VTERIDVDGDVSTPIDEDDLDRVVDELAEDDVEAVAICFLHSYQNGTHEQTVKTAITDRYPHIEVSTSSAVSPEIREYRRMSTTAVDAYLKNIVTTYLSELEDRTAALGISTSLNIMKSDGGAARSGLAKDRPVNQVISGPVAGVKAAQSVGERTGIDNIITFDMGGTSCDTSIIDQGEPVESRYREIRGMPINGPFVKIDNVGAGGGSVAWLNDANELRVGPESAGADPGPACYGFGGEEPTVTDADLILGLLNPENFAGGQLSLDLQAARDSVREKIAEPLGIDVEEAALGIRNVIDSKMAGSVRTVSIKEGYDPRRFALIAFGGAGPAHAGNVAEEIGMKKIVFPHNPGTVSSLGCMLSDLKHTYTRSVITTLGRMDTDRISEIVDDLVEEGRRDLEVENIPPSRRHFSLSFDLRYEGQAYNLNVESPKAEFTHETAEAIADRFERRHRDRYGFVDENNPIELVNVRITASGHIEDPDLERPVPASGDPMVGEREVLLERDATASVPYYEWDRLGSGDKIGGPCIVESSNSTAWIPTEYDGRVDEYGNIRASRR
jgi:N-methylhydantoinase A